MEVIIQCLQKAERFLDRVCGITDTKGIILATTDSSLLKKEDHHARELAESEANFKVSKKYSYMKLDDQEQSYICFVQGDDAVAYSYLNLLVEWISSEISDLDLTHNREMLIKNVLLENELPGDIPIKAKEYKITFSAKRFACVLYSPEISLMDFPELIKDNINPKHDYWVLMDDHTLIILKEIKAEELVDLDEMAKNIVKNINFNDYPGLSMGVGMPVDNLRACAKSYREASLALTVGDIFEEEVVIRRYDKLGLSRLIYQLPATLCYMFLNEVFPPNTYESLGEETLVTIERFFENNLNGSETSRQLFVHRNTLVYRLDKVQKVTGLDLRNFDDAVLFKLASMVRKYLETLSSGPQHYMNPNTRF